jgi:PhnB protein
MPVPPIPDGYTSVTPYLIVRDAAKAIDFYKEVFDAVELMRLTGPDGKIGHAELRIGNARVMLADEMPEMGYRGPLALGGSAVSLLLYVDDVDRRFERALAAGAESKRPVADQFYGDRSGTLVDPYGHQWSLATHKEDVPQQEVQRRYEALLRETKGESASAD